MNIEKLKETSQRKLPISGPMLQKKTLQFAKNVGNTKFKASNDWLKNLHKHIAFYTKGGKKADVDVAIVEDWKETFPTLLESHNPCDMFNMNETGLFLHKTENNTSHQKGQVCSGGKKAKIYIFLTATWLPTANFGPP